MENHQTFQEINWNQLFSLNTDDFVFDVSCLLLFVEWIDSVHLQLKLLLTA